MPAESSVDLITALATGEFDDLVGTPESVWVDFKRAPYQINSPKGRWELAKDVAAFANSNSGHIVIGVTTQKHEFEVVEAATSWSPIPKDLIDADAYRKIVGDWIYPRARNVEFRWFLPVSTKIAACS